MSIDHPSFGKLDSGRIIIFDTTLRDGEQSPGFSMNLDEKLRMAEALHELGADVLEAGFAIASPGDFASVQSIAKRFSKDGPVIASLSRANTADILSSAEATKHAARPRIHIVLATSDLHMRVKLRMTREDVLERITESVKLARDHAADVEWSAEDGSRSDLDFLCRCVDTAIKAGATTINIPDTVGYSLPADMGRTRTRSSSPRTTTMTWVSPSPTRWPPSRPARGRSSARSTASGSARAMRPSRRSRWRCAPGRMR
jgi:2-isopropylmalate synthase